MKKNIGIDATLLNLGFSNGIKTYSENLLQNLASLDTKNSYYVFLNKYHNIKLRKNFRKIIVPKIFPFFNKLIYWPFFLKKYNLDIYHSLDFYGPLYIPAKKVITTIHDVDLSKTQSGTKKLFLRLRLKLVRNMLLKISDILICPTNFVKKELRSYFGHVDSHTKIIVINEGVDTNVFSRKNIYATGKQNYFMAMADYSKRKNIITALKALSKLSINIRKNCKLIIVTPTKAAAANIQIDAIKAGVQNNIKILTNPDKKVLATLYRNSIAFVYPSLYEGFGLPILEAMASGTPVITSKFGAIKEVAGNAAYFVDPRSAEDISAAMNKIYRNKKLRDNLIKKSLKHVKEFSWKKTAGNTLKIYNNSL